MILFVSLGVCFLFGTGFYLLMKKGLLNRALGLLLISHGANFVLMSMGGLKVSLAAPILDGASISTMADPLPQALILTALVIGFGVAAYLWSLILRLGKDETK